MPRRRTAALSPAARLFERQRAAAAAALVLAQPEAAAQPDPIPAPICQPALGTWRLPELGPAQCRFACTGFHAAADAHRFCGQPIAWLKRKPTSWCAEHLPVVMGAPGRSAGGLSVADAARSEPHPQPKPILRGWGATGVASRSK